MVACDGLMADAAAHFRAHERRPVRLSATLRREDGSLLGALVVDLSLGGAGVELREALPIGTALLVELTSPTLWDPLPMRGTVVWSQPGMGRDPSRAGVRFVTEDSPNLFALFEVLAAHAYE